jgi:hypothetical protein
MSKAMITKDWANMVMNAHMSGYITKTQLKSLLSLLPNMEATFDGTMSSVSKMTEKLMESVKDFQKTIPTDGTITEGVGNQVLIEMVKTGGALIRKVAGLMEGAF